MQLNDLPMTPHPENESPPQRKTLVSVERQYETDVATGQTATRMFVKMYFAARDSGLLADIGDRRWRTLCCLATYMDENGRCWPTQDTIARDLGVNRQRANERIRDLAAYRFDGRPLIRIHKRRQSTGNAGRYASNSYEILSISGLGIFNHDAMSGNPEKASTDPTVSGNPDMDSTPVSGSTVNAKPDTNKNEFLNQKHKTFNVERDAVSCSDQSGDDSTSRSDPTHTQNFASRKHGMTRRSVEQANSSLARTADGPKAIGDSLAGFLDELEHQDLSLGEIDDLVHRIEQATGDRHSRRRFQAIAQRVPKHVIERLLGDIKSAGGDLRNPGAFFEKRIQTECRALDIELPRNRQSVDPPASIPPADPSPSTPAERALE